MTAVKSLKTLRKEKNLTQAELAHRVDLSTTGYANIERGDSSPTAENLVKIAKELDVDVDTLIQSLKNVSVIQGFNSNVQQNVNRCKNANSYSGNTELTNKINDLENTIKQLQLELEYKDKEIIYLKDTIAQKEKDILRLEELNQLLKKS